MYPRDGCTFALGTIEGTLVHSMWDLCVRALLIPTVLASFHKIRLPSLGLVGPW